MAGIDDFLLNQGKFSETWDNKIFRVTSLAHVLILRLIASGKCLDNILTLYIQNEILFNG